MIFMLGSVQIQLIAVMISGATELFQRSTIVLFDDFLRAHVFKAPIDETTRAKQIEIWSQDICGTQLIELCTIPILGLIGPIMRAAGQCDVFFLSEVISEQELTLSVFVNFLTEGVVDIASSYVERRQGIKIEAWWKQCTVAQMAVLVSFMMGALSFTLWMTVNVSGEHGSCPPPSEETVAVGWNATWVLNTTNETNSSW